MPASPLSVTILSRDASEFCALLTQHSPGLLIVDQHSDQVADIDPKRISVLLADPDLAAEIVPHCPHLQWCQSTWAGNAPLLAQPKQDYVLTGVKNIFGEQMREYVFAHLLYYSREIARFQALQRAPGPERWMQPPTASLAGQTLAILGAGSIAAALVPVAQALGMTVIGLNRNGTPVEGYQRTYSLAQKCELAAQADAVVNLLPDTPATRNVIEESFLRALPSHAVLINAGRGAAIDDEALLDALDKDRLRGAVLDVFRTEPLPAEHPYWAHPKVLVTQHTAAISHPSDVADIFLDNAQRYYQRQPLQYVLDFNKGY
ncbi:D-2-hydroxyacid dehydrogenase [Alteromonas sp. ASW11-19]|uniref:D-2-hydroxyacid dehydrogenase n=2 Tax=Alteromonas salexigens TaxID=2982530 RepID=A0ABT2VRB6_9ALTE|nr:D-2-hydroxyacid dehydrogenase [Alteromonas salexigens]